MTDFNDVTHTFTDGLDQISAYIPKLVELQQAGDKTFLQRKDDLTGYEISFSGSGAKAFVNTVNHNVAHTKSFDDNWNTFSQSSSNLSAQIKQSNDEANPKLSNIRIPSVEETQSFEHYSYPDGVTYTIGTIWQDMQEAALKSSDMNTVMDKGLTHFTNLLDTQKQNTLNDIKTQHTRRMSQFKDPNGTDANAELTYYTLATRGVNSIHDALSGIITIWFHEITPILRDYSQGISSNKLLVPATLPPLSAGRTYNEPWGKFTYTTGPSGSFTPWAWDPKNGNLGVSGNGKVVIEGYQWARNDGWAGGLEIDGPSGDIELGQQKGAWGANANLSIASVTGSITKNIAGANVTLSGTVQAGVGIGLHVSGKKFTATFLCFSASFTWGA